MEVQTSGPPLEKKLKMRVMKWTMLWCAERSVFSCFCRCVSWACSNSRFLTTRTRVHSGSQLQAPSGETTNFLLPEAARCYL